MRDRSNNLELFDYKPVALDDAFPVRGPGHANPPPRPHLHDCFEIGLCVEGGGVFVIGKKIFSCSPGCAVFINNQEFHILKNATPQNSRWRFLSLDPARLLRERVLDLSRFGGPDFQNVVKESERPDIVALVRDLMAELEGKSPNYQEVVRGLVWLILLKLGRFAPERGAAADGKSPELVGRISPALHLVATKYDRPLRIEDLAEACNCSLSNFRKLFTRAMGRAPQDYLLRFRLNMAATRLVNTDLQISEVASRSGFPTLSNFNRVFRQAFHTTPRQCRASGR